MPAEASPLCSIPFANANPACWAEGAIGNAIEGIAGGAVRELAQAVVGSVQELFGAILDFLATPVRPDLQAGWFAANVDRMIAVSATFALLFFLFGLGQAIVRSSMRELGRVVGFTVLAFAVSGVALALAQGFIALVDVATGQIAAGVPSDLAETFSGLMHPLTTMAVGPIGQALLAILLGILAALGALAVYLELFVRNVMIHVVVYFLPLMLVGTIWAPTRRWAKRGIEFLAVLILSKFVVYAVIALGWSAVASFNDQRLNTAWATVLVGLVLRVRRRVAAVAAVQAAAVHGAAGARGHEPPRRPRRRGRPRAASVDRDARARGEPASRRGPHRHHERRPARRWRSGGRGRRAECRRTADRRGRRRAAAGHGQPPIEYEQRPADPPQQQPRPAAPPVRPDRSGLAR